MECWDALSAREKESIPLDQICLESAAITPGELLGEVVKAAFQFGQDVSSLMAATCLPEVVGASIKFAKHPKGIKDRIALMQHANFVPIPKSSAPPIMIRNYNIANAQAEGGNGGGSGLPTFEEQTMDLAQIVRADDAEEKEDA